jgi:hypothetical protein
MTAQELLDDASLDAEWTEEDQIAVLLKFIEEEDRVDAFAKFLQVEVDNGSAYDHDDEPER